LLRLDSRVHHRTSASERMFQGVVIVPSAMINFWKHSRKGCAVDMAHMTGYFGGLLAGAIIVLLGNVYVTTLRLNC